MGKIIATLLGLLTLLLGSGLWIGLGLIGTGVGLLTLFRPNMPGLKLLAQQTYNVVVSPELLALPLFILMAEILFRTKISEALFTGLSPWLRRVPGRLSHLTVLGCTMFASVCGSSAATTATVGRITAKELIDRGYNRDLVTGSLAGAGTLGFLIPPSTIMIIYGVMAEESILRLFIAGIVPGLMLAASYMGYLAIRSWLNPALVGATPPRTSFREKMVALKDLGPLLLLIAGVIGSMYGGIASPTEAATVGVVVSMIIGFAQRTLTLGGLLSAARQAAESCAMIGLIMIGAMFLSTMIGYLGVPRYIATEIQSWGMSPLMLVVVLLIFYVLLGTVMEGLGIIVMTLPITLPLAVAAGYDKVWFGIFLVIVVEMAQITPPVGFNLTVIQRLTGDSMGRITRATMPFFLIMAAFVLLIAVFPGIIGFLPDLIRGN
ncbi:TRAP transporter large permease subunit [Rhodobacter sphaeroides]|jgi:tripartite ATP-independent transporter DctM subunit|uniref:TRAP transporter large permease protein n=1 Tax=Cereibacter sphaeroides (strain ATCC 17023 / DSM 158 / JCM 6121 / CCUG 31486 / LMG 2827 / NBRC 12203 / NCIMB 8253 / ATH 2.4.1.) TaxID=272943 RepID=Q3IWM9_CERS4|nr:TRAP transporter large permease subunit [Cereibacter sphaeroides]ABA81055.1 TRAP-T family transporter, large (12TMs) inner membrane subunit [Cereibacter sphaeroides 2.4.1]AMJ49370.1 C4-dicarboxylate ABC transporter permease [Cereibacter sphaeroides]ANS36078.1 C4-dicarboxylate ABC transporter permease [Cereibacter sphaeroides]ATN65143.1 C4-dicarboxylate ABC transporter permease [Cereibacter sphaeroides]AXC63346.1 C4-dicarboxylate ABC transporter permease [Cereibacter sphaeroides 2.4.1]